MKKKVLLILALLCAAAQGAWADDGWSSASSYDKDSDADKPTHYDTYGGRSDVHVIKTAANYLYVMDKPADYCNKNIYLDINVDVSSKTWINLDNILGLHRYMESWGSGYRGTFYGNGHTIRINLDYESYSSYKGPFGIIAEGGKVQDLNVEGTIYLKKMDDGNGTDLVGGICGENNGTIENCSVSASVSSEENYLGGITGRNTGTGTISNCRVSGNVSSDSRLVGGIAGENNGTISNCWVSGNVSSDWKNSSVAATAKVGGIAGENNSTVEYCCMTGNVSNDDADVGGLVGDNDHSGATVRHCTFYGTRNSTHDQASIYVGDSGTEEYLFGIFSLDEYNAASGKDMYRHAIRYTYDVTVNIEGHGTVRTRALDEDDVPGTCAGQTFSLNVTSGTALNVTVTDADGNNVPLQGHANDNSNFWFVMPSKNVTATVTFGYTDWPTQGAGTVDDPYIISSAEDWNDFAYNVRIGRSYSGQCVKLTSDISVSTMAGAYQADDNYHPFSGTFDGDGHTLTINVSNQSRFAAPFKCVNGATIKNLRTAGTIDGTGNADGKLLAGLVGVSFGNTTITGCRSSVTLTTAFGEDAALAGLVAGTKGGSLTIAGCVFDGSMTGASNTRCAGIAGYEYGGTTTSISNCLFTPTTLTVSTTDDSFTKTISRDPDATITNCYYTQPLGAAQGTEAVASATAPPFLGALLHDYGFVKAYAAGLLMDGNYYYDARIITSESTTLTTGTYTVNGNVTVPSRIQINGTVVLNLGEDATLHAPKGIEVDYLNSANLTINGPGTLTIDSCNQDKSGIGSLHVGTIVINGGNINVNGGAGGAGIGGDDLNIVGGHITINGGVVNATGGKLAAGIGGGSGPGTGDGDGDLGRCGDIIINGGQVTAIGGYSGPGIGPGNNFFQTVTGTLTLGWTHSEDFVYSTGYVADPNSPWRTPIRQISFVAGKQFMIDGTATIATEENLKSSGTTKIVPYEAGQQTLSGSGTEGEPYLISSTADWNKFVHNVLDGNSYNSQYVKLMADIDITKCVGVYDDNAANARPFSGSFLGNNHTITATITDNLHGGTAPFRYISGATIKNLTVAGTIASNQNHTSGLVGFASGTNLIENCIVTATLDINSDYAGGFVGHGLTSTTTIKGCIFSGHYNGRDIHDHDEVDGNNHIVPVYRSPNNIASFWGWSDSGTPTLENCLEKGTYTNIGSMHPMGLQSGSGSITNCYYLNPQVGAPSNACTVSGAYRAYTVNTVEGEMLRPLVLVDGNTYYTPCLIAADDYYHRTGSSVGVTPVVTASNGTPLTLGTDYTATLNGEAVAAFPIVITTLGPKNFTITGLGNCNGSKSISFIVYGFDGEGTEESPYIISNTDQWDAFASEVNLGNACSGKHVKLTADISVTTMVGYRVNDSDNKPFSGTFNGDGHTITATIEGNSNQGNAPFRYIDGATIRNLTIAGTIASNQYYSSGLVGFASGTNLIEDCIVTATLNIRNDSYVGGFVGHGLSSTTTIRNCIFAGGIYGIDNYLSHAGSFWGWSDNATPTLENCVEMGYYNDRGVFGMHPMGLLGGTGTLSNCYYKNTQTRNPTNAWTITPNSDYGRIYTEPSATEIRKSITINGTTVYSDNCTVSGVTLTYLTNDAVTPVVTEPYNSIALTLGTNYTVTLDGESVESFPLTLTTSGSHTLIISGTGGYMGSKRFNIVVSDPIEGDGTLDNPYLISNDENWNLFTSYVNSGTTTYSGKYVKLMADINVSDMVGTSESNSFQGTFLGNGHTLTFSRGSSQNYFDENDCAPFRYVKNATIQDLKVTGAIYTSQKYAGGLVANSYGTTNINNCQVGTFIRTNYTASQPHHGGIVAYATGTLNITGCVFNGRLLKTASVAFLYCGGILGHAPSTATVKISNTLYAPAPASGENVINTGSTFVETGYSNTFTLTNCYHTETMGKAQGTQVYTISGDTGVTVANAGTVRNGYSVSGLTFYTTGIKYNDVLYGGNGSNVSLTLTHNRPGYFAKYAASAGTLTDTGNPYTLTMPDENVTISVAEWVEITFPGSGTAGDPYTISNSDEWNNFAYNVNSGNNFSGKFVRLDADIAITDMCGTVSGTPKHAFCGTFLGNGHTITVTLDDDGNQGLAPFRYINGATIKDLKVTGTIASSQYHTSGLVGFANGTNTIEDCLVSATLNITSNYAGGIIGHGLNSNTTIRGCAFAGTINGVDGDRNNIGGIWGWSTSGTPTLLDCLENGTYTNIASMHPMGLQGGSGTITNCYYMNPQVGSPINACTVSGAKQAYTAATTPANLGSLVEDYGMVKAYANGIWFDGNYYVKNTLVLTEAAGVTELIDYAGATDQLVSFTRSGLTANAYSTMCLPFSFSAPSACTFYAFKGIGWNSSNQQWEATISQQDANATLSAHTPYIFKCAETEATFTGTIATVAASYGEEELNTGAVDASDGDDRNWKFKGTYTALDWTSAAPTEPTYGFSTYVPYDGGNTARIVAGTFVRFVQGASLAPFRARLIYSGTNSHLNKASIRGTSDNADLPRYIVVRIINNNGTITTVGAIDTETGEITNDAWFTLEGKMLTGEPTESGIYIYKGQKVSISK